MEVRFGAPLCHLVIHRVFEHNGR